MVVVQVPVSRRRDARVTPATPLAAGPSTIGSSATVGLDRAAQVAALQRTVGNSAVARRLTPRAALLRAVYSYLEPGAPYQAILDTQATDLEEQLRTIVRASANDELAVRVLRGLKQQVAAAHGDTKRDAALEAFRVVLADRSNWQVRPIRSDHQPAPAAGAQLEAEVEKRIAPQLRLVAEGALGKRGFLTLADEYIAQNKPGAVDLAVAELERRSALDAPAKLQAETVVLLGDTGFVRARVERYVDALVSRLEQLEKLARRKAPLSWAEQVDAREFPDVHRPDVGSLMAALKMKREALLARKDGLLLLEQAAAGDFKPLATALGLRGFQRSTFRPTPGHEQRPSESVIAQAAAIREAVGMGREIRLGHYSAAVVRDPSTGLVPKPDEREDEADHQAILKVLLGMRMRASYAAVSELADIFWSAKQAKVQPLVLTGDWSFIEPLGIYAGIRMWERPTKQPIDEFLAGHHKQPFVVRIHQAEVCFRAIPTPSNQLPDRTATGDLVASREPPALTLGRPLAFWPKNKTDDLRGGYIEGFDVHGDPKVIVGDDPEIVMTLTSERYEFEWLSGAPRDARSPAGEPLFHPGQPPVIGVSPKQSDAWARSAKRRPLPRKPGTRVTARWRNRKVIRLEDIEAINAKLPDSRPELAAILKNALELPKLVERPTPDAPAVPGRREQHLIQEYLDLIQGGGYEAFIVGGAVRDRLLGDDPKDIDLASTMPALDFFRAVVRSKLASKGGRGGNWEVRRNLPYGTVQVEPSQETGLDVIHTHGSGHDASLRLEFDALARDFTVNAVYFDPARRELVDPTGLGLQDLEGRVARFILGPGQIVHEPVLIGRWLKFLKKQYVPSGPEDIAGIEAAIDHFLEPESGFDAALRARLIERMGMPVNEALAIAAKHLTGHAVAGLGRLLSGDLPGEEPPGEAEPVLGGKRKRGKEREVRRDNAKRAREDALARPPAVAPVVTSSGGGSKAQKRKAHDLSRPRRAGSPDRVKAAARPPAGSKRRRKDSTA